MPCPVTSGFLYSLEHNLNDEVRNTSFEFIADAEGSFPALRLSAVLEPDRPVAVYKMRSQYAIQFVIAQLSRTAPGILVDTFLAPSPQEMLEKVVEVRSEIEDLITVSKMKRRGKGDATNMRTLSDRLLVREALGGVEKQLRAILIDDYRQVGFGLGDCFRGLHLSSDRALKIGRKLLSIQGET